MIDEIETNKPFKNKGSTKVWLDWKTRQPFIPWSCKGNNLKKHHRQVMLVT